MAQRLSAFAPAKVNLFLHVGPPGEDGYHPLSSWMVFADLGDELSVSPAEEASLELDGPFAAALIAEPIADNLVARAAERLFQAARDRRMLSPIPPLRLLLTKRTPVAAGLGGGSSDAGAALRLLREVLDLDVDDYGLEAIAAELGADGPACLWGRPTVATGRGDQLGRAPLCPPLDAVLVNPRTPSPTGAVYRAFDAAGAAHGFPDAEPMGLPMRFTDPTEVAAVLSMARNDLEGPAAALTPAIADVLGVLREQPETLLARLSGSGATCFALCGGDIEAETLAERLQFLYPDWWTRRCRLGGPWEEAAPRR